MREAFVLRALDDARAAHEGCSLCGLERAQVEAYLTGVAGDGVNDVPLRRALAEQGGYCAAHTAQFAALASPLSAAILLLAFVEAKLGRAKAGQRPVALRCAACGVREAMRAQYARSVGRLGASPEVQRCLRAARLCLVHLGLLAPRLPRALRLELAAQHDALVNDLSEVVRKHDYRVREAITPEEIASLRAALALLGDGG